MSANELKVSLGSPVGRHRRQQSEQESDVSSQDTSVYLVKERDIEAANENTTASGVAKLSNVSSPAASSYEMAASAPIKKTVHSSKRNEDRNCSNESGIPMVEAEPMRAPRLRPEAYPWPHPIEPEYPRLAPTPTPPPRPPLQSQDEENHQDKEGQQPLVKRYWKWATVSLVLLVVILAVVLGVVLGRGGTKDASESTQSPHPDTSAPHVPDTPTDPPTPAPTDPPVPAPTDPPAPAPTDPPATVLDDLVALFSNTSPATATALQDKTSNQYQAMEWLEKDVEENGFDFSTDEDRILARGALAILFYSTNGDGWNNSTGWLDHGVSECDWYGVTCSSTTVTELLLGYYTVWDVSSNNLVGILPPEIGLLLALQVFLTGNNTMTGTIATELGSLTNLRELFLWGNQFTGTLPSEFGLLTNLEYLDVHNNSISGTIPTEEIIRLTNLRLLGLYDNKFTGTLPSEFGLLTNLVDLWVNDNSLTGTVPTELGELKKLGGLTLFNNEFTGQVPSQLCAIDSLTDLLADCGGSPPEIECTCCTMCCPGGDYC